MFAHSGCHVKDNRHENGRILTGRDGRGDGASQAEVLRLILVVRVSRADKRKRATRRSGQSAQADFVARGPSGAVLTARILPHSSAFLALPARVFCILWRMRKPLLFVE